jgi:hypothetical protein
MGQCVFKSKIKIMKKILESLTGVGMVTKDGLTIAKVGYSLEISQEITSDDKGGSVTGMKEGTGRLIVMRGVTNLVNRSILELKMEDGRIWRFFAVRGDLVDQTFYCKGRATFEPTGKP